MKFIEFILLVNDNLKNFKVHNYNLRLHSWRLGNGCSRKFHNRTGLNLTHLHAGPPARYNALFLTPLKILRSLGHDKNVFYHQKRIYKKYY
jgi:hypothetical protein